MFSVETIIVWTILNSLFIFINYIYIIYYLLLVGFSYHLEIIKVNLFFFLAREGNLKLDLWHLESYIMAYELIIGFSSFFYLQVKQIKPFNNIVPSFFSILKCIYKCGIFFFKKNCFCKIWLKLLIDKCKVLSSIYFFI